MLSSIRTPRVSENIVAQLERAIYEGRLQRGDKLPAERQLVREFKASRVAVREALRALELRGFVEVRQGSAGGYFIRDADAAPLLRDFHTLFRLGRVSLAQLIEARLLIEPDTAALAAVRASDAEVKTLAAALDERAERRAAGRGGRELDMDFHRQVASAARNPVHAVLSHALMELEVRVVPRTDLGPADDAALDAAHRRILDAIAARQPEAARAAMHQHIADLEERLAEAARKRPAC